jgi:hypothetical protein
MIQQPIEACGVRIHFPSVSDRHNDSHVWAPMSEMITNMCLQTA